MASICSSLDQVLWLSTLAKKKANNNSTGVRVSSVTSCCWLQSWCFENYVNYRNLMYAVEVRKQLAELCQRLDIPVRSCAPQTLPVRRCLLAGLFLSVAEYQREGHYLTVSFAFVVFLGVLDTEFYRFCT